ncbi:hypothetical protein [Virgibacillus necropolis]|uniref:Uncharacterized protein n=1 Tax=Virgibacillus necropolis TaxID=163877 RepID=A0A221MCG7_9BACI|nr:hypothetical protein [Virgibacillus necropolis]ASN05345.1 hypothetical protein CFK40_10140 [Virgibacillus necropolis]
MSNKITLENNREFLKSLKNAKDEADIEQAYKRIFQKRYIDDIQNATMNRPYGSDGYLRSGEIVFVLRMLMEFKKGTSLIDLSTRARIIAQVVYYLKRFEQDAKELPNVIFSGDEEEMFIVYAPVLYQYLKEDYDWSIAPSDAPYKNLDLLEKLHNDPNLSSFVFDINTPKFNMNEVLDSIDSLVSKDGKMYKIKVYEANVRIVFDEYIRMIFSNERKVKMGLNPEKDPQLLVSIFIQSILGEKEIYPVPSKKNTLHLLGGTEIKLDTTAFIAFFSRYERKYTIEEKDILVAIADQLIEETSRRFSGDFWTPTVWANRANDIIDEIVGENWRNDYVVWDPACGTKNLTRDYQFNKLYSSTIHQEELDMSTRYNKESVNFRFDFLNDDIDVNPDSDVYKLKMPKQLFNDLRNDKPIVFFANPPYGTANNAGAKGTSKKSIAQTKMNKIMKNNKMGSSSQQLYAQFFYRVLKLKKDFNLSRIYIAFFSKTQFLTGGRYWEGFEKDIFLNFHLEKGILFNAGEFTDVSDMWAVTFGVYKSREVIEKNFKKKFNYSVEELSENGIKKIQDKTIHMINQNEFLSEWLRDPNKSRRDLKKMPYPQFSSAFNVNESKSHSGRMLSNSFGYMVTVANNIYKSQRDVFILSGSAFMGHGLSVTSENFERVVVTFASRKSVKHSWINDMDNFKKPDVSSIDSSEWEEFVEDCMIYSLFHIGASYQTSLSNVEYQGDFYDIGNEWFFMSYQDIKRLAQQYYINETEEQLRFVKKERIVYNRIANTVLSYEAQGVYDRAVMLLKASFKHRYLANQEYPEWNVKNWDAGFYQVYKMIEKYNISDLERFRSAFLILEEKIERRVYRFGMLTK